MNNLVYKCCINKLTAIFRPMRRCLRRTIKLSVEFRTSEGSGLAWVDGVDGVDGVRQTWNTNDR